jgi:hypothetical protein
MRLQYPQLGAESDDARARNIGQPLVICIGGNTKQLLDTMAPDRRDDPELGKVSADALITEVCWRMNK